MTSIVKTEFFVKLFFLDFKKEMSSADLRKFRFLDTANCLVAAAALGAFAITAQAGWIILGATAVAVFLYFMYKLD